MKQHQVLADIVVAMAMTSCLDLGLSGDTPVHQGLLILGGVLAGYLITTYLLSYRVYVTAPGDVNINDSMVTVWEAKGKINVHDNKKTKK